MMDRIIRPEAGALDFAPDILRIERQALKQPFLEEGGSHHKLAPGMQVSAEIHLGARSVLEYLLSPVKKLAHEAGRER